MNNDLISREALKKAFEDTVVISPMPYAFVKQIIDNAPTVEPCYQTTSCLDCQMYDKENHNCPRFCEVIRSAIEERPQGEFVKRLNDQIEKSVCKFCQMNEHCELCEISRVFMIIALTDKEMICSFCGAEMRKPNCITCDHFGKCEGCEQGEEE